MLNDTVNRAETALFPRSISEMLPPGHIARFYVKVAASLDLSAFEAHYSPSQGRPSYAPSVLLAPWLYGYTTGLHSSRKLERATREQLPFMYIAAGEHPDHTTLANFRKRHLDAFKDAASQFLLTLVEAGVVNLKTLAIDGTKLKAYAAREKMMTAKTARERTTKIQRQIERLLAQSAHDDDADAQADEATDVNEDEVLAQCRREVERCQAMAAELEAQDRAALAAEQADCEAKVAARAEHEAATGAAPRGRPPKPQGDAPKRLAHQHLTDADATWMNTRDGIQPAYNAQAGVDVETQLVVTADVTTEATDHHQIKPTLEALADVPTADAATEGDAADRDEDASRLNLLADAGYHSADNIDACAAAGVDLYIAKHRDGTATEPKGEASPAVSAMVARMASKAGKTLYGLRKCTVVTTFGCIKEAMGFRYPTMRGLTGIQTEWQLACLAWNLKRAFSLGGLSLS